MSDAIGQILAFGVVVGISPVPIIAVVLMLSTPRGKGNGLAFLVGWVVGLGIVGTIVMLLSNGGDASENGEPATWVGWVKLAAGLLLVFVAYRQFHGRPKAGEEAKMPKWMTAIDHFKPRQALQIGLLLSAINPKNLLLTIAAGAAIAATGISTGEEFIALAVFVLIGTVGVGAPVVIYFALGERSQEVLGKLNAFLAANNAVIMAALIGLIGVKLVGDGLSGLG